jgi:TusA-related sulfurtransferase
MSLLRVKRALSQLEVGAQLDVHFRDQASLSDAIRFIESTTSIDIILHNKLELRLIRIKE